MKNTSQLTIPFLMLVVASSAESRDYRSFRDYAPVLNVVPIIETSSAPITRTVCDDRTAMVEQAAPLAATIGEDIRRQIRRSRQQSPCRTVTETQQRQRVRGYRVTYRYGGQTSTVRYPYDPGKRIPVDVDLSPLP